MYFPTSRFFLGTIWDSLYVPSYEPSSSDPGAAAGNLFWGVGKSRII